MQEELGQGVLIQRFTANFYPLFDMKSIAKVVKIQKKACTMT